MNELGPDVEKLSPAERRERRNKYEEGKWEEDYYMSVFSCLICSDYSEATTLVIRADYVDDEHIQELLAFKPPPDCPWSPALPDPMVFTEQENVEMLKLPKKECSFSMYAQTIP